MQKNIAKTFREQLTERMAHNDATFNNVYANIDISFDTHHDLFGLRKLKIEPELINRIYECVQNKSDFALAAPNDEIVFFIGKTYMVVYGKKTSITQFRNEKDFENSLKLTIVGHRELITGIALKSITAYQLIAKRL